MVRTNIDGISFDDERFIECFKKVDLDVVVCKVEGNNGFQMGFYFKGFEKLGKLDTLNADIETAITFYNGLLYNGKPLEEKNKIFIDFIYMNDSRLTFALGFDKNNVLCN